MTGSTASSKNKDVTVFDSIESMSASFYELLINDFTRALLKRKPYHLAISGGSTPYKIFDLLTRYPSKRINWEFLNLYWVDERCVPPDDTESNYGNTWKSILRYIDLPEQNIHRIHGEDMPESERKRYSEILAEKLPQVNGLPQFDMVLLGIGEDGHTASIFPGTNIMSDSSDLCVIASHPETQQKRISLSLDLINNSKNVLFLVTGNSKAKILDKIINEKKGFESLPAANVNPKQGKLKWFLDKEAAKKLKKRFLFF